MKLKGFAILLAATFLLGGCSSQTSKNTANSSSSSKSTVLWNSNKDKQLADYMKNFSTPTGRDYQEYTPTKAVNFYGEKFPSYLTKNKIMAGDNKVSAKWSTNGSGTAEYNVVAIYSDIESSGGGFGSTLYLFAIQDKTPVVLSTQQNQGTEDKMIHFDVTNNTELANKFAEIVTGKKVDTNAVVPAEMQGIWYGYNKNSKNDDKIDQIVFTKDSITINGKSPAPIHDINERTADDMAIMENGTSYSKNKKARWNAASFLDVQGRKWLNLRGWFQTAGAGSFYSVKTRTIDGQNIAVLTTASGANVTADGHFYKNKEVAIAQGATTFADENNEN